MGRGGHGGKTKGRGSGRKMYIANVEELAMREGEIEEQREARRARRGESDDEDDSDEDDENDDGGKKEAAGSSVFKFEGGDSKTATAPKTKSGAPNAGNDPKIAPKMMKLKDLKTMGDALPVVDDGAGMNRKQREALDAEKKQEDYLRRRMAGETPEARRDLERLKEIRARREQQKKIREAEGRAPGWKPDGDESGSGSDSDSDSYEDSDSDEEAAKAAKAKKVAVKKAEKAGKMQPENLGAMSKEKAAEKKKAAAAPADEEGDNNELPVLKAIDIKKMNPNELKENLKARNLSIQGAKKDLAKRLQDFDAAREKEKA